jgi:REP element-mobilizing transposase RayT
MQEAKHINKLHHRTLLLYHLVFPVKYRRKVIDNNISETIKQGCLDIEQAYEISFVEIGTDEDQIHFLVQGIPNMSVSKIITIIKSITAREIFSQHQEVKKFLYGGNFWTKWLLC